LILASIHTGSSPTLWKAVHEEAERQGVDLFIFPGGPLETGEFYERQRNQIYELVGADSLDGIISWASSLGGKVSAAEIATFHERFCGIPCVTLSYPLEGFPCVSIDAYRGMRELLNHFLQVHQVKSIAFIRGPATHVSAEERYRAYVDTMRDWGIEIDPLGVTDPMPWDGGEEAAHLLIHKRNRVPGRDFQALVGASDLQMFGAVRYLQQRGYRIPEDILVGGFNNITESRILSPQLTTVAMPFQEQGMKALRILLKKIRKKSCPEAISLPTHLVIRESCGCPSLRILKADPSQGADSLPVNIEELITRLASILEMDTVLHESWVSPLVRGLEEDLLGSTEQKFLKMLHAILERSIHTERPISCWQDGISLIRKSAPSIWPTTEINKLETICTQARVMISDAVERSHTMYEWHRTQQDLAIRETGRKLLMATDMEDLQQILSAELPNLGIPRGYISLSPHTQRNLTHTKYVFGFPGEGEGQLVLQGEGFFEASMRTRGTYFVQPLFHQQDTLGYVVLELDNMNPSIYEEIRTYISSAIKGILLHREVMEAKEAAESAERFKSRMLANFSEEFRRPVAEILMKATEGLSRFKAKRLPSGIRDLLVQIRQSAEHQLHITTELIDLAKAEVKDLPLRKCLMSPLPILRLVFEESRKDRKHLSTKWELMFPESLPWVFIDEERFVQILHTLRETIDVMGTNHTVRVQTEVKLPYFRIRISHSGLFTNSRIGSFRFSLAHHLAVLHGGQLEVEKCEEGGTDFLLSLPLPTISGIIQHVEKYNEASLLCLGKQRELPSLIKKVCREYTGAPVWICKEADWQQRIKDSPPIAIYVDLDKCEARDLMPLRMLMQHPLTSDTPYLIFSLRENKKQQADSLMSFFRENFPPLQMKPVICVSADPTIREAALERIETGKEEAWILLFSNLQEAVESFRRITPSLILLDLAEVDIPGIFTIPFPQGTWVILLAEEVSWWLKKAQADGRACLLIVHRGILSIPQYLEMGLRVVYAKEGAGAQRSIQILHGVIVYIERHYGQDISRWQLADLLNVSEDYLSRVFRKLTSIAPWEYLLRYRIRKAQGFLRTRDRTIREIADACGFHDQAYFCRVFRTITGTSPRDYQKISFQNMSE
jgi:DNA-binding LacI/PurR family transcriptional regulator/AraC-like DNA-binding protein/signal transduction histidine kinase